MAAPVRVLTVTAPAQAPLAPDGQPSDDANPYDLVDLPTVKDELELKGTDNSKDRYLRRTITQVSLSIASHCNRVFPVEGLTELIYLDQDPYPYQTPGGVYELTLQRWPLANLLTPMVSAGANTGDDVLTFAAITGITEGQPVGHANAPAGTTVAALSPPTQIQLSQALTGPVLTGDFVTIGLAVAQTLSRGLLQSLGPKKDFDFIAPSGRLIRLNPFTGVAVTWEAEPVTIWYSAGYATIPPEVQGAALVWLTERYHSRGHDPSLMSEGEPGAIGFRRWWVGGPQSSGAVPEKIVGMLEPYRVPVVA
ncbi:MAG TPA: hypothetical protein VGR45_00675 [Stellaceae bacterium]|nr:hypothetical protein [Stellaceae bacterium]